MRGRRAGDGARGSARCNHDRGRWAAALGTVDPPPRPWTSGCSVTVRRRIRPPCTVVVAARVQLGSDGRRARARAAAPVTSVCSIAIAEVLRRRRWAISVRSLSRGVMVCSPQPWIESSPLQGAQRVECGWATGRCRLAARPGRDDREGEQAGRFELSRDRAGAARPRGVIVRSRSRAGRDASASQCQRRLACQLSAHRSQTERECGGGCSAPRLPPPCWLAEPPLSDRG